MWQKRGMSPEEFRRLGHQVVDWIADYRARVERLPVRAKTEPGAIKARLPASPPLEPEGFEAVLRDLETIVEPGLSHWQHPRFFGYFPSNGALSSVLGDFLSTGLGVLGLSWQSSPALTEIEEVAVDWARQMFGLSAAFSGVIQDTASSATLCALLAGRERATGFRANEAGADGRLTAYASTQAHSSVEKAVKIAGIGRENLRLIEVDADFAMRPDALAKAIADDRRAGKVPCFVCATVGTTSSNAIDPVGAIGTICREQGVWLHVDAAMSGSAALCPEFRWIHDGVELADSYCFNPHKWMFTNFDCDAFWVADRAALIRTMSVLPEYLKNKATESGAVFDYRDWQIPLGRRFRALKLWFVIRHYGVEGLQAYVRQHVELAQKFKSWIEKSPSFELAAPAPLNLVCFRHVGGDAINRNLLEALNVTGDMYLTHTSLDGRFTLRMAIGQSGTEEWHVREAWKTIQKTAIEVEPTV